MSRIVMSANPAAVELEPEPIPPDWVLSGSPVARSKKVSQSHDWASSIVIWDCTAGSFKWHYGKDEAIIVVSGEAFLTRENGAEQRFGPGDLGFFPAGTSVTWRVAGHIRKIAVLREPMWRPLGFFLKVWNKILRTVGISGKSPL